MIENVPQQSEAIGWLIGLFLKLLAADQTTLALASSLLSTIGTSLRLQRATTPMAHRAYSRRSADVLSKLTKIYIAHRRWDSTRRSYALGMARGQHFG